MCVMSMVHDHYEPIIPWISPAPQVPWVTPETTGTAPFDWVKLVEEFRKAQEAAKTVDSLTGQKDCLDPNKAKLEERVRELEAAIASGAEFVLVKGASLEPGTYRVVSGKLHRVIE